jgi:hypothetical protein
MSLVGPASHKGCLAQVTRATAVTGRWDPGGIFYHILLNFAAGYPHGKGR